MKPNQPDFCFAPSEVELHVEYRKQQEDVLQLAWPHHFH